jgi:hypothetical protein
LKGRLGKWQFLPFTAEESEIQRIYVAPLPLALLPLPTPLQPTANFFYKNAIDCKLFIKYGVSFYVILLFPILSKVLHIHHRKYRKNK